MEGSKPKCLQTMVVSEADKWHAGLCHIGRESMKSMIKREFVVGIPNVEVGRETCSSCLLGKQARHCSLKQHHTVQVMYYNSFTGISADLSRPPCPQRTCISSI